ncbi:N-acetylglucosamine kinase [Allorhodopirellula solitaria]|uniref:Glucosamine kinase GspK n=1 Tax=Allorhodopirellula solitaria TaxID=2527987 RepID=A0A5C5YJB7_9BACT|nr:BadF/BadG/BcrA/BcrD ATPase family protein [Allorhodopirellula solitaria]TWT74963.1 Glucosamine kinase GspK [Allorhodopirellula solitaria]
MNSAYVLGVDAGGSKTRVSLGRVTDGQLHGITTAVGGAGNPRSVGFERALGEIGETVQRAFQAASIKPTTVSHACLCIAGAGRQEEQQRILDWCVASKLAVHPAVVSDAECLLAASDSVGVALIAGTGSMAWGCSHRGQTTRAGGCGYLLDDEGSGFWLGKEILRHCCMSADARQSTTSLVPPVLAYLDLASPDHIIAWCYDGTDARQRIASLAPLVFEEYGHDAVAQEIVHAGAHALADLVAAVSHQLRFAARSYTLACAGSVLLNQPIYRELLESRLRQLEVEPREVRWIGNPAEGALELAWKACVG